jgi:hypothetical protein
MFKTTFPGREHILHHSTGPLCHLHFNKLVTHGAAKEPQHHIVPEFVWSGYGSSTQRLDIKAKYNVGPPSMLSSNYSYNYHKA